MISAIHIPNNEFPQFKISNTPELLSDFSHLNTFIGINNSGKSRLLRELFYNEEIKIYGTSIEGISNFHSVVNQLKLELIDVQFRFRSHNLMLKEEFAKKIKIDENTYNDIQEIIKVIYELKNIDKSFIEVNSDTRSVYIDSYVNALKKIYDKYKYLLDGINRLGNNLKKLYIPILRGLRPIQLDGNDGFNNEDSYLKRTEFDYFSKMTDPNRMIFSGLSMYKDVMRLLLGNESERKLIQGFEKFLEIKIFKENVTLIPRFNEDVLHIKLGNDNQFPIFNLGDGLQTLITILFPLYVRRNIDLLVFIEEPESHLHPKWQSLLSEALVFFKKHTFFISTHSAAFVNTESSSLFLVKKNNFETVIDRISLKRDKVQIVQDLGYKPSDLFQTNFILWVEGPSDQIYVKYWINSINDDLIEGIHYSIMFFGGDNYKNFVKENGEFDLSFLGEINQNFGIIMDSDRKKRSEPFNKGKKKIKDTFELHKYFCWLTKYREIENYIPIKNFREGVVNFHKKKNIEIGESPFDDRNTIVDLDAKLEVRSTIKLPPEIFTQIQKNEGKNVDNIDDKELRTAINRALRKTEKRTFRASKVEVAKAVVATSPKLDERELLLKMKALVKAIKIANSIEY